MQNTSPSEKPRISLPTLQELGVMYNYKPEPVTSEKVNLEIDWSRIEKGKLFEALKEYESAFGTPGSEKILYYKPLKTLEEDGEMYFRAIKEFKKIGKDILVLEVQCYKGECPYVANFHLTQEDKNEWEIKHRQVFPKFREQGIGSRMVELAEDFLKNRAQKQGQTQIMSMEVAQADLLFWLLKRGYMPATPEDEEKIQRIGKGDPELTITSGVNDNDNDELRWYIFEKEKLYEKNGKMKPGIWLHENYGQPIHYVKSSFRIKLKKEFRA